jgi:hypothetical protein
MALFTLHSEIEVGHYKWSGVHEVEVRRGMTGIMNTAVIKLPKLAVVDYGTNQVGSLESVGALFEEGDYVHIQLGYASEGEEPDLRTEFKGFLRRKTFGMPIALECEGYSWQMRKNVSHTGTLSAPTAEQLLKLAVGRAKIDVAAKKVVDTLPNQALTDIKIMMGADANLNLRNVNLNNNNGHEIVQFLEKMSDGALRIFFIDDTTLWCGYPYTAYVQGDEPFSKGIVDYSLGYNCIKDNGLRIRTVTERTQVVFGGMLATGQRVRTESDLKYAWNKYHARFSNTHDEPGMKRMANEKQYYMNYEGYQGSITGFLQPFCQPGWAANVYDKDVPERDGKYMVLSTTVRYTTRGARRIVELGPLLGFKPDGK